MSAMLDDTADIPLAWLTEGVRRFRDSGRAFLPSVAEIRQACAEAVRDARRVVRGERGGARADEAPLDVPAVLRFARERAPLGYAQLAAIEGERIERERIEASSRRALPPTKPEPRGQSAGAALSAVLAGLRVVDERGRDVPVPRLADEIATAGVLVPPKNHSDPAHAMQGRWLAHCLALVRLGHRPVSEQFTVSDWERADRSMRRHRSEGGDAAWWFDGARDEWRRLARADRRSA